MLSSKHILMARYPSPTIVLLITLWFGYPLTIGLNLPNRIIKSGSDGGSSAPIYQIRHLHQIGLVLWPFDYNDLLCWLAVSRYYGFSFTFFTHEVTWSYVSLSTYFFFCRFLFYLIIMIQYYNYYHNKNKHYRYPWNVWDISVRRIMTPLSVDTKGHKL